MLSPSASSLLFSYLSYPVACWRPRVSVAKSSSHAGRNCHGSSIEEAPAGLWDCCAVSRRCCSAHSSLSCLSRCLASRTRRRRCSGSLPSTARSLAQSLLTSEEDTGYHLWRRSCHQSHRARLFTPHRLEVCSRPRCKTAIFLRCKYFTATPRFSRKPRTSFSLTKSVGRFSEY